VNDPTSFSNVKQWLQEVDRYACESVSKVLVGGKADQPHRAVDYNTAKDFADALGMPYIETSAKTGENVDQAFLTLTSLISTYVKQPNLSADSHYTDRPYSSLSLSLSLCLLLIGESDVLCLSIRHRFDWMPKKQSSMAAMMMPRASARESWMKS
jgi:hypothetical protein